MERLIYDIYKNLDNPNERYRDGVLNVKAKKDVHFEGTYGELTVDGYIDIIKNIPIELDSKYHFYDLGSGTGKVLMCAALFGKFNNITGVEYLEERHCIAKKAFAKLIETKENRIETNIYLVKGNLMNKKYFKEPEDAIYFISNLCFSDNMNNKVSYLFDKYRKTEQKTIIICSKKLDKINNFTLYKKINVEMTWNTRSLVYIYKSG